MQICLPARSLLLGGPQQSVSGCLDFLRNAVDLQVIARDPFSSPAINDVPSCFTPTKEMHPYPLVFFILGDKDHFFFFWSLKKVNQQLCE